MILVCEACGTRFLVADEQLPPEGRVVKCAKCAHSWLAHPQEGSNAHVEETLGEAPESVETDDPLETTAYENAQSIFDEGENEGGADIEVPELSVPDEKQASGAGVAGLKILAGLLLIALVITGLLTFRGTFTSAVPATAIFYSLFGYAPTDGLVLADVSFKQLPSRKKDRFLIRGYIINQSDRTQAVPMLRISLLDETGKVIKSREYVDASFLKPQESFAFKAGNLDTSFVGKTKKIAVEIGSAMELDLRE